LQGYDLPWEDLHQNESKLRLRLPTYQFFSQPFWFENAADSPSPDSIQEKKQDIVITTLSDKVFKVLISENHLWLRDHIVSGHKMLPGVAHLAIILQIIKQQDLLTNIQGFANISWLKPIICHHETISLVIELEIQNKESNFKIKCNEQISSCGIILFNKINNLLEPLILENDSIMVVQKYDANALYDNFKKSGINYGEFFRGLKSLSIYNTNSCFAEIFVTNFIDYIKTNLLDSAFQSILGLSISSLDKTLLPFSARYILFEEKYILDCGNSYYVNTNKVSNARVNINIFNNQKENILSIYDLGVLPMAKNNQEEIANNKEADIQEREQNLVYKPQWYEYHNLIQDESLQDTYYIVVYSDNSDIWAEKCKNFFANRCLLISLEDSMLVTKVTKELNSPGKKQIWVVDADNSSELQYKKIYKKASLFINFLQKINQRQPIIIKLIAKNGITLDEYSSKVQPQNSLLIGLAQTAAKEFPSWIICSISTDDLTPEHIKLIQQESNQQNPNLEPVLLSKGKRFVRQLSSYRFANPYKTKFRNKGTYLIIGGLGGLGFILSEYLAKNYNANLILIGRSPENLEKTNYLRKFGNQLFYEQVDLLDEEKLQESLNKYTEINGIIHSALTLKDKTIQFMDEETLMNVLDPKVRGSINMLNVTLKQNWNLDFILFFSSIQSFIANPGQANYTAACVFKDSIASLIRNFYMYDTKVIHWGYWGSVGIVSNDEYRLRMEKLGIGSIESQEGLGIIEEFLASELTQIVVLKASKEALSRLNIKSEHLILPQENQKPINELLAKIVPDYNEYDSTVIHNYKAQQALENYVRYAIKQIKLPEFIQEKYLRLKVAIQNLSSSISLDKEQLLAEYSELAPHIRLLDHCLRFYPEVLSGKIDHMSVLFPDGKFDLVEPVYRDNPVSDYFNKIVAKVTQNYLSQKENRPIKIIEIGAGTGSTTKFVLPAVKNFQVTYYYTDLSLAFLKKAQNEFESYSNLEYQIYNIETAPTKELENQFDILIATNVLHATSDIKKTLHNVRKLLKNNGIAVINEVTTRHDFATLTFGLTPGWWLFQDHRIPDSPLLNSETWLNLLKHSGFSSVSSHGSKEQQVIVGYGGHDFELINKNNDITLMEENEGVKQDVNVFSETNLLSSPNNNIDNSIISGVETFITSTIAQVMRINSQDIKNDVPFSSYGIDSLIVLELLKPLKEKFDYLPSTIFFEYPTIIKLRDYLFQEYSQLCKKLFFSKELEETHKSNENNQNSLKEDLQIFLKKTIGEIIRIDYHQIKDDIVFKQYGIDSLIILEIIKPLTKVFGYLPNTLLFEYPTITALCDYLYQEYKTRITEYFDTNKSLKEEVSDFTKGNSLNKKQVKTLSTQNDDVAIIGIAGIFPQAINCQEFWNNLYKGLNCITEIPEERWNLEGFYDKDDIFGKSYTKYGGFIKNPQYFDNEFFSITPFDAENMDPQERLFLQTTYHAVEDAGYPIHKLTTKDIGVFVGVMNGGYSWLGISSEKMNWADSLYWSIANRVSYSFDWSGPSMAVDTACSSSLTAIHLACQAIKNNDCSLAIAGGVNLIVHPKQYTKLCRLQMLSKGNKCKSFGEQADGFVDGEGIVSIVLKNYIEAVKDNDRIYGIIRGSSINSGGKSNGYSAPNPNAQANLIKKSVERANIPFDSVSYVETHGTGTELGDPIEIRGLTKAFDLPDKESCPIGSVKSNIGHLESAAGIAGVIKVLLQIKYKTLVPSLHSENENPHLNLTQTPFYIQKSLETWHTKKNLPRRAIVSSFGAGGSNATIVLEEHSASSTTIPNLAIYILPISAHSISALQGQIDELRMWFKNNSSIDLYSLAYTLSCCKQHHKYRICLTIENIEQLEETLSKSLIEIYADTQISNALQTTPNDLSMLIKRFTSLNSSSKEIGYSLCNLYINGKDIPWEELYHVRKIISLPNYYFDKISHWIEEPKYGITTKDKYIKHHKIMDTPIAPAALSLVIAIQELKDASSLENIFWLKKINSFSHIKTEVNNESFALKDIEGNVYIKGKIGNNVTFPDKVSFKDFINDNFTEFLEKSDIYHLFTNLGYNYGELYQRLQWIKRGENSAFGVIIIDSLQDYIISPTIIDAGLQIAITPLSLKNISTENSIIIPYYLEKFSLFKKKFERLIYCYCVMRSVLKDQKQISYDLYFFNHKEELLMSFEGMQSKIVNLQSIIKETLPIDKSNDKSSIYISKNNQNFKIYDLGDL